MNETNGRESEINKILLSATHVDGEIKVKRFEKKKRDETKFN